MIETHQMIQDSSSQRFLRSFDSVISSRELVSQLVDDDSHLDLRRRIGCFRRKNRCRE